MIFRRSLNKNKLPHIIYRKSFRILTNEKEFYYSSITCNHINVDNIQYRICCKTDFFFFFFTLQELKMFEDERWKFEKMKYDVFN